MMENRGNPGNPGRRGEMTDEERQKLSEAWKNRRPDNNQDNNQDPKSSPAAQSDGQGDRPRGGRQGDWTAGGKNMEQMLIDLLESKLKQ